MRIVVDNIKPIMIVSGLITCSMLVAAIAPQFALQQFFGPVLTGDVAEIVVRNWGGLIALVGGLLIYGAGRPEYHRLILSIAIISKSLFIVLVLIFGANFYAQAATALIFDVSVVIVFAIYLLADRKNH